MFPNTHDVVPADLSLEQYERRAQDLVDACRSAAPGAIREWAARWPAHVDQTEPFARETMAGCGCALGGAQSVVARLHGFETWLAFAAHLEALTRPESAESRFEAAADAIVDGDAATLDRLLREQPALIHARSTRGHRAMLLHYAAANGVEGYRQKTPPNAVAIARTLLAAGAEVDAEAQMYGGGCTTLGLVATSVHPERAGVQDALMQILLDHGAVIDTPGGVGRTHTFVVGCLANGRGRAAEYLAARGARLDLEGAAGIGRLDLVQTYFDGNGALRAGTTAEELHAGFAWACEYGRTAVVAFLLEHGVAAGATVRAIGQTGLHWAALGGHGAIVSLLLERGAPVNIVDGTYHGTPLTWARFGQRNADEAVRDRYDEVIAQLTAAGGVVP